jgi:hypothetical protein
MLFAVSEGVHPCGLHDSHSQTYHASPLHETTSRDHVPETPPETPSIPFSEIPFRYPSRDPFDTIFREPIPIPFPRPLSDTIFRDSIPIPFPETPFYSLPPRYPTQFHQRILLDSKFNGMIRTCIVRQPELNAACKQCSSDPHPPPTSKVQELAASPAPLTYSPDERMVPSLRRRALPKVHRPAPPPKASRTLQGDSTAGAGAHFRALDQKRGGRPPSI